MLPKVKPVAIDLSEKKIKTSKLSEFYQVQLHNQLWKLDLEKRKTLRRMKGEIIKEHGNLKNIHKPGKKRNATVSRSIQRQCPDTVASRTTKPSPVVMAARRLLQSIVARKSRNGNMSALSGSITGIEECKAVYCWNGETQVTSTRFNDRRLSYSSNSSEDDVIITGQVRKNSYVSTPNTDNGINKRQMRLDSRSSESFEHSNDECDVGKCIETSPPLGDKVAPIPYPQHIISSSFRSKSVSFCVPGEEIHSNSIYLFRKSSLRDFEYSDDPSAKKPLTERRRSLTGILLWRETGTNMCDHERTSPVSRAHGLAGRRKSETDFAPKLSNNQKVPMWSANRMLQRRNSASLLTSYLAKAKTTMTTSQLLEIKRLKEMGVRESS